MMNSSKKGLEKLLKYTLENLLIYYSDLDILKMVVEILTGSDYNKD